MAFSEASFRSPTRNHKNPANSGPPTGIGISAIRFSNVQRCNLGTVRGREPREARICLSLSLERDFSLLTLRQYSFEIFQNSI